MSSPKRGPGRPPRSDEPTVQVTFTMSAEDARWLREHYPTGKRSAWLAEKVAADRAGTSSGTLPASEPGDSR